jgi:hypothetical protein
MKLTKSNIITTNIYPFVDELVETLCTPETKNFIHKHIENDTDKQTFLMFIFLYFTVELKLMDMSSVSDMTNENYKEGLKYIISDIIKNPDKRKVCIEMFNKKFNHLFIE